MKNPTAIALIVLAAVGIRIGLVWRGALPKDDAYITYRYAENLAAGVGFVYNAGERVLGVTTPLYVLILAALVRLGMGVAGASLGLGIAAGAITLVLLWRLGVRIGLGGAALFAPVLYAVHPNAVHSDISGMESPLFALGVVAACYAAYADRRRTAAILLGFLCLLRPEGALLAALYVGRRFLARKPMDAGEAGLFLAIVLPWVVVSWMYFGSPVPNSIPAKLVLYRIYDVGSGFERLWDLLGLHRLLGWPLVLGAAGGWWIALRRYRFGGFAGAYLAISIVALAFSHVLIFFWYKAPLTPLLCLFCGIGLGAVYDALRERWGVRPGWGAVATVAALGGLAAAAVLVVRTDAYEREEAGALRAQHLRAASVLAVEAEAGDVVIADDIGYVGYGFRGRIIDRSGLVSPAVIPYNAADRQLEFVKGMLAEHPEHWFFIATSAPESRAIMESTILADHYELVADYDVLGPDDFRLYRTRID